MSGLTTPTVWNFAKSGASAATDAYAMTALFNGKIIAVHMATTASVGTGSTIADVNIGGTTIFTTQANRPTLAITVLNGESGAIDGTATFVKGDAITVDVDTILGTTPATDLCISVVVEASTILPG